MIEPLYTPAWLGDIARIVTTICFCAVPALVILARWLTRQPHASRHNGGDEGGEVSEGSVSLHNGDF